MAVWYISSHLFEFISRWLSGIYLLLGICLSISGWLCGIFVFQNRQAIKNKKKLMISIYPSFNWSFFFASMLCGYEWIAEWSCQDLPNEAWRSIYLQLVICQMKRRDIFTYAKCHLSNEAWRHIYLSLVISRMKYEHTCFFNLVTHRICWLLYIKIYIWHSWLAVEY